MGWRLAFLTPGGHCCSLELTLSMIIPSLTCSPLPLRKFNSLPCHCYNDLQLLDTTLSMTVIQNQCHTHLGQAVLQWYVFIPCGCHSDSQEFPSVAAQGEQHKEELLAMTFLPITAFLDLTFFFVLPQSNNPHLCWWLQPHSVLWLQPCAQCGVLFKYALVAWLLLSKNFQSSASSFPIQSGFWELSPLSCRFLEVFLLSVYFSWFFQGSQHFHFFFF